MRKHLLLILVIACGISAQAGVHRCGTLNIRINSADDKDEKAWDNRKAALVAVIRDSLEYDMIGLNEVTSTQLPYLEAQLGDTYTFVQRTNVTNNQVLYRTAKYDCLASGFFYLAPDPTKSGKAWDAKETRWVVWVRLKDKVSGERVVFASTHFDLNPISIREGARVATEQLNLIAGDDPCIVTGDMNCEFNEHDPHANLNIYFGNARQLTKTEPQGPYGTYIPAMNPATLDSKLLDYIYVRNVEVESYRVFNSPIKGRTLAISDHRPVITEVTLLSSNREFVHTVKNVAQLRQVAATIQPNDIIYLKEGTFDLGDSTLHIANTCVIESGKNAVLTGSTQLISLSDYLSLELKNVTINQAQCSVEKQGALVFAHGAYLKMDNCTIENCSTIGDGLIYTNDCATTLEKCTFRGNHNELLSAGVQMVSSLGVDRYPLTMKNCLFDSNEAYTASALYFTSEATAYIYGNSFINNVSEEKGVIAICAFNNTQDIRLVNNTFVHNRIDVEAGFMVEGIGGSAIWQEQAATGTLTLMNNTITGNYTACWDQPEVSSTDFPGGAVCASAGQIALYNNVLAGNFGSKAESGDITMGESATLKSTAYNIFSSADNMQIQAGKNDFVASDYVQACLELQQLYEGTIDTQGAYHPQLRYVEGNTLPILSPFVTKYAGMNIAVLDMDALSASQVGSDIMNQGSTIGFLTVDQVGTIRHTNSVPGSMEEGQVLPLDLQPIYPSATPSAKKWINNQVVIQYNNKSYNLTGIEL